MQRKLGFRKEQLPLHPQLGRSLPKHGQVSDQSPSISSMQRQIDRLKRTVAQKEHEVWTLKQLLLYR
jgi:hypothetical protein